MKTRHSASYGSSPPDNYEYLLKRLWFIRKAVFWELALHAYKSGKGIIEIIRERNILTEAQIADLLDPVKLTNLDKSAYRKKSMEASRNDR